MLVKFVECIFLGFFDNLYVKIFCFFFVILEYLSGSCMLIKLIMFGCFDGCLKCGFKVLVQVFYINCVFIYLDLGQDFKFDDEIVVVFSEVLEINIILIYLNLLVGFKRG